MKFDDLDLKMQIYETAPDRCVLPNIYMVARLDGRNFTRLTKETYAFEAPFDEKFRDLIQNTPPHLAFFLQKNIDCSCIRVAPILAWLRTRFTEEHQP